VTSYC